MADTEKKSKTPANPAPAQVKGEKGGKGGGKKKEAGGE
jgi:hypothetical protein